MALHSDDPNKALLQTQFTGKNIFDADSEKDGQDLRKAWFNYVLLYLEKMDNQIDAMKETLNKEEKELLTTLTEAKEFTRSEMKDCRQVRVKTWEDINNTLKIVTTTQVSSIESLRKELQVHIDSIENKMATKCTELSTTITNIKDKDLKELRDSMIITKAKLAIYMGIASILASSIVSAAIILLREHIASLLGM